MAKKLVLTGTATATLVGAWELRAGSMDDDSNGLTVPLMWLTPVVAPALSTLLTSDGAKRLRCRS